MALPDSQDRNWRFNRRDVLRYLILSGAVASTGEVFGGQLGLEFPKKVYADTPSTKTIQVPLQSSAAIQAPLQLPASYIIFNSGGTYYALNCATDNLQFTGSTADVVINDAIGALPLGGIIHLVGNTSFTLSSPINFNGGFTVGGVFAQWILEGEGAGSLLIQNTANTDAIDISNKTRVHLRNFNIQMDSGAGVAINGLNTGTNECCTEYSRFEDIQIFANSSSSGGAGNYASVISLVNFFDIQMDNIFVTGWPRPGGQLMLLQNNSSSGLDYGNSLFNNLQLNLPASFPINTNGLVLTGTAGQSQNLGILEFNNLYAEYNGSSYTGINCLLLNRGLNAITFNNADLEAGAVTVNCTNATGGAPLSDINFFGGYFSGQTVFATSGQQMGPINFHGGRFSNVGGGTRLISDQATGSQSNSNLFDEISTAGNNTSGIVSWNSGTNPIFRGSASNGIYWSNQGVSKQNGNGSTKQFAVAHKLLTGTTLTPRYYTAVPAATAAGIPFYVSANATNLYINFATAPPSGSGNVVFSWQAAL